MLELHVSSLARPAVVAPLVALLIYLVHQLFLKPSQELPDIPVVGAKPGDWFPLLQAKWRNTRDYKGANKEAYARYRDQAVIVPAAGLGNMVLLPASETQWVIEQDESDLSLHESVVHSLQLNHILLDPKVVHNPTHHRLITTKLTSKVGDLVPDLVEEAELVVTQQWGADTREWREVCVWETARRIIGSVTNRPLMGVPLCRDAKMVKAAMTFAQEMMPVAQVLKQVWAPLRWVAALLVVLPNRIHERRFRSALKPEVVRRLREYPPDSEKKTTTTTTTSTDKLKEEEEEEEPNDFLQWSIRQAYASGDPYMWQWKTLAGRLLVLNLAAIHNSSFTLTHALLDLLSSKQEYIDELRREIAVVLAEAEQCGRWDKRALARAERLDSVLRESLRLNSFMIASLGRIVTAPGGLTTPGGVHLPRGTFVSVPSYTVLHDGDVYSDPWEYRPFRSAELRREEGVEYVRRARNAFSATSDEYLVWGHGRGACIGRFFAAAVIKVALAYIVMNYDFELLDSRPRNTWFGVYRVPPMKATIRVKRREREWCLGDDETS